MAAQLTLTALPGIPMVEPGDDLAALLLAACDGAGLRLQHGDVLVIAQKIVSKAEGRYAYLNQVEPSPEALELAPKVDKDPRLVELILRESKEVVRFRRGAVIVEHRLGYVHANAGIDRSNIRSEDGSNPRVLLLPEDPNASARQLREAIRARTGAEVAVIINDSAGRAWRQGVVGFAIGSAGIEPLCDMIGQPDLYGRPLEITLIALADELAAAGSLLMGQGSEGSPAVLARGVRFPVSERDASVLIRPKAEDLFRS